LKDLDYKIKGKHVDHGLQKTLKDKRGVIFQQLELTLTGLCNRFCSFCPRNDPAIFKSTRTYLSREILKEIYQKLSHYNYAGRISIAGFGEPFTHPQLDEILKDAKEILPKSTIDIITNGDFMKTNLMKKVLENDHYDRILISAYDGDIQVENLISNFSNYLDKGKIIIRKRYLSKDADELLLFSNRTGLVDYGNSQDAKKHICFYPFYNIFIDSNGDVILCSHDWEKNKIFGNIYEKDILDIWFSRDYKRFRETISSQGRKDSPCSTCNVDGRLYGKESFLEWKKKPW
tara:strand:- start:1124 stop:1990 length:867 start_codon:yes stop_codon:yes gene_type:complete